MISLFVRKIEGFASFLRYVIELALNFNDAIRIIQFDDIFTPFCCLREN